MKTIKIHIPSEDPKIVSSILHHIAHWQEIGHVEESGKVPGSEEYWYATWEP